MAPSQVIVSLTEKSDGHTPRRITLDDRNDSCLLGRASRKGADILAQPDNGYFENPVVSRNHAEIRADFLYERVYVKDIGSTHGTYVNNVRIPATVRHPIRTGDIVTLGVEIKSQGAGVESVHPSIMTVGVKFGTRPPVGTNVFQVPDETSVEGSEPEDTIGRARRFLHEHGSRQVYDAIDLTEDGIVPFDMAVGATDMPEPAEKEDENEELPSLSESEAEDDIEDYPEEEEGEEDGEDYAEDDVEDDMELEEQEYDSSLEASCTCVLADIEPSSSNAPGTDSTNPTESEALVAVQATSSGMDKEFEDGNSLSLPDEGPSPLVEGSSQPGEDPSLVVQSEDATIQESANHLDSESAGHDEPTTGGQSTFCKKRKAAEISKDDEPESPRTKDKEAPVVNVLPASGVQTDPSGEREPKRLRRAADIVGYTALGGLAGALAVFTTLVVSAPSFS